LERISEDKIPKGADLSLQEVPIPSRRLFVLPPIKPNPP
jgi:hypothetical protein